MLSAQKQLETQDKELNQVEVLDQEYIGTALDFLIEYEFIRLQNNEETQEQHYVATRLGQACLGKFYLNILQNFQLFNRFVQLLSFFNAAHRWLNIVCRTSKIKALFCFGIRTSCCLLGNTVFCMLSTAGLGLAFIP